MVDPPPNRTAPHLTLRGAAPQGTRTHCPGHVSVVRTPGAGHDAPMSSLRQRLLPQHQRRDLDALTYQLDLSGGDRASKVSAFWTMLVLSAVIAVTGVLSDSTATVIGAMIIAPLSVPIMGVALGIIRGEGLLIRRSVAFVAGGMVVVVAIGCLASLLLPSTTNILNNSQVMARTSPGLLDMIAAIATGFAGAVGLSRKDVSDVLPGVAIAISLVPPLGVVGVCLGQGQAALAMGALLLFLSNFVALVLAGTLVFTGYGYTAEAQAEGFQRRHAYSAIAAGVLLVLVPLVGNTVATTLVALWTERIQTAAEDWIADVPGGRVVDVTVQSTKAVVHVEVPGDLPSTADLMAALDGQVPNGVAVVVDAGVGERIEAGVIGQK